MILSTGLHSYIFILEYHNDKNMLILHQATQDLLSNLKVYLIIFLNCWQMIHWDEKIHFIVWK